ncbi:unnamed protein product [Closterium sp. NIES-53]
MIDRFFRPFLGGIFFDNELSTSSRLMEFVLRMLALAPNTLPSSGIGALASHLASRLPSDSIRLNSPVSSISPVVPTDEADSKGSEAGSGVPSLLTTQDGKRILAKGGVIVAVEQPVAQRLLLGEGGSDSSSSSSSSSGDDTANITSASANQEPRSTVCLYFASDSPPPVAEPILFLNGSGSGIVNNLCFPSVVSPSYAPPGKTLVSVSLVGAYEDRTEAELEARVRTELAGWFGKEEVDGWRMLRVYRIPFAQPGQRPPTDFSGEVEVGGREGVYVCGDHKSSPTFDGALASGRRAAEALLAQRA